MSSDIFGVFFFEVIESSVMGPSPRILLVRRSYFVADMLFLLFFFPSVVDERYFSRDIPFDYFTFGHVDAFASGLFLTAFRAL